MDGEDSSGIQMRQVIGVEKGGVGFWVSNQGETVLRPGITTVGLKIQRRNYLILFWNTSYGCGSVLMTVADMQDEKSSNRLARMTQEMLSRYTNICSSCRDGGSARAGSSLLLLGPRPCQGHHGARKCLMHPQSIPFGCL